MSMAASSTARAASCTGPASAAPIRRGVLPVSPPGARVRPARVVAAWAGLVTLAVAGSSLYLSLLVHTALAWRTLDALTRELERERRRGEQLEVALARALAPSSTEEAARILLAMERPRQVDLVVVSPGPSEGGPAMASAPPSIRAGDRKAFGPARGGPVWVQRARAALADLLGNSMALARRLPQWP